jgi:hypothetical protein
MKDDFVFPRTGSGAPGMELRDLLAAHVVTGALARDGFPEHPTPLAIIAYKMADSMMKVRGWGTEDYENYIEDFMAYEEQN